MYRVPICVACLTVVLGCGDGANGGEPGPIVDNLLWEITEDGDELFGSPPSESTCPPPSEDCPTPDGACVVVPPGCRPTYIAECFDPFTVLAVYTDSCSWVTLEQPLLRDIRAGDEIGIRTFHFALNAPSGGEARVGLAIGEEMVFDRKFLIPQPSGPANGLWVAPKDIPAGTRVLFHVDNHGSNEYLLVEANLCPELESGDENLAGCSGL